MRISIALMAAVIAATATPVFAEEPVDYAQLALCMMANSGDNEAEMMKKFLLAALSEDIEGMQTTMASFGAAIITISMGKCGLGLSQVEDPGFKRATEMYGEMLGQRVMEKALSALR